MQPAAREITRSAGPLAGTLAEVEPLRESAVPTLRAATEISPDLVKLAEGATPVVRKAAPTIRSLAVLGEALPPISDAVDGSFANLVATLENWSQAIQFRDGLSHVFRGAATFSPDTPLGVVEALTGEPVAREADKPERRDGPSRRRPDTPADTTPSQPQPAADDDPGNLLDQVLNSAGRNPVGQVLDGVGRTPPLSGNLEGLLKGPQGGSSGSLASEQPLLDYLLGP